MITLLGYMLAALTDKADERTRRRMLLAWVAGLAFVLCIVLPFAMR